MKIIAILSWYDERPSWLAGVVASLSQLGAAHIIAVDGAYGLYPHPKAWSDREQQQTILETARGLNMGCTMLCPQEVWMGNEVEKRNMAWKLAETVAEPYEDWYFIIDADTTVTYALAYQRQLLETEADVAQVGFKETIDGSYEQGLCPLRCMFRAIPGLRFDTNHFTYRLPDGRNLHTEPDCCNLMQIIEVQHNTLWRDPHRREHQKRYYDRRDELRVEYPPDHASDFKPADRAQAGPQPPEFIKSKAPVDVLKDPEFVA